MTGQHLRRPTRRRLEDTLLAALAPILAFSLALGGLTIWADAGKAGSPARIAVTSGRVFLPYGDSTQTAAFFDITNTGGADDRLVAVTSSETGGGTGREIGLSRHRMTGSGAAYRDSVASATVPAGGELSMSPRGLDVTLRPASGWRAGDLVSFTLHFEHSGPVKALAIVVSPSDRAS
ncbi:copper chaperone PCu(A)C [Streptomyces sp. HUCO-GS316]|uniref:copper chaperone PCu(A)C n=1 Tax=Streptomyces sp. HUCO-GS316 TaxID=2692198 RepID=UPI0013688995|nr:copper chaperone PCu(A)C [Streptomyces sp. HUCO-GS316]MXM64391.1 copper chaperone PCu(A)C [Streptomyces sp. HUCO-GS316]